MPKSQRGKASMAKYAQSAKRKATRAKYAQSAKGKAAIAKRNAKAYLKRAAKKQAAEQAEFEAFCKKHGIKGVLPRAEILRLRDEVLSKHKVILRLRSRELVGAKKHR